jgi:long-chain acyl-CoA synthetase
MTAVLKRDYSEKGDTWPKVLKYNNEKYGDDRKAMRYKHLGIWHPYTWKDYYQSVKYLALGLVGLGFKPQNKVLIIGDNAPQWYITELAAQSVHGVSVGLYSDLSPSEIKYFAQDSEADFAIIEDQEQVDKFLQIKDDLPLLKKVIYWNYKGLAHYEDENLMNIGRLINRGKEYEKKHTGLFEKNVEAGKADDVCAIVYTSGTTGDSPKGAVHTYRTMRVGAEYYLQLDPWYEEDNVLPYLPPAGMTEQWFGIGCHLLSGCILNFAEAPQTQQRDTIETGPSIVYYGARLWESLASTVQARILDSDVIKRFTYNRLMPIGYKAADSKYHKEKSKLLQKIIYFLADAALFKHIRNSLGLTNARICYSNGAVLSPDAMKFFHALNLPLISLYGSTEGGALTGTSHDNIDLETVGLPYPGTELKITELGEIVYRQPGMFIEYYNDPDKTKEVVEEGWFHSGDCGFMNKDGYLVIDDRLKDLIKLSNGEKIAPQMVESRLRFSPYITDAWVLSKEGRGYASAVIVINYDNVSRWAGQMRVQFNTFIELSQRPEVYDLIRLDIDRINKDLRPEARIKKYVNLHKAFDPDDGELTRNRKLRKIFLAAHYRDLIDAIYKDQTEARIATQVKHRDGRIESNTVTIQIKSVEGADS